MRRKFRVLAFFRIDPTRAFCRCNVSTPGANGTLYGGSDLDGARAQLVCDVPRERNRYQKNPPRSTTSVSFFFFFFF